VNPGGEPERDDTGLPPVDIEIPDDARELDRDVQAYFRELRAERRRRRRGRWHGSLARDGIVLPLLACCLILALITGTLLTVFTATSDQNLIAPPGSGTTTNRPSSPPAVTSPPASSSTSAAGAAPGASLPTTTVHLPDVRLIIDNQRYRLLGLTGRMLVLIPPRCNCATAVSRLATIGAGSGTALVGTPSTITEAQRYQTQLGPRFARTVVVALDGQGVLQKAVPAAGLTAVVISPATSAGRGESVAYASNLTANELTSDNSALSAALAKALGR
jgi:hypothetical protein